MNRANAVKNKASELYNSECTTASMQRRAGDTLKEEDLTFCRYRLSVLYSAPYRNSANIEAVEKRIQALQCASE